MIERRQELEDICANRGRYSDANRRYLSSRIQSSQSLCPPRSYNGIKIYSFNVCFCFLSCLIIKLILEESMAEKRNNMDAMRRNEDYVVMKNSSTAHELLDWQANENAKMENG